MVKLTVYPKTDSEKINLKKYLKSKGLAFEETLESSESDTDWTEIQNRISEKYVKNGEWDKMDDEDRTDAVMLEERLWREENPDADNYVYTVAETKHILEQARKDLYANQNR
jgi:hypothetical protein